MPSRRLLVLLCLMLGGLALVGCASQPSRPQFAEIAFTERPPIKLDVREVVIEQAYSPSLAAPNVEHLFHVSPAGAAARWAQDRLAAAGPMNRARFIVREASVVEVSLKQSGGVTGAVTTEQSERYDARLVVEIQITSEQDGSRATLTAEATRSRTVPENLTLTERELVWHDITRSLLRDLDIRLEQDIRKIFFTYLLL